MSRIQPSLPMMFLRVANHGVGPKRHHGASPTKKRRTKITTTTTPGLCVWWEPLAKGLRGEDESSSPGWRGNGDQDPNLNELVCHELLLMEEIRLTTWYMVKYPHYLHGFTSQVVSRISEPSTARFLEGGVFVSQIIQVAFHWSDHSIHVGRQPIWQEVIYFLNTRHAR